MHDPPGIAWQPWSKATFDGARLRGQRIYLNMAAGWCHWCHVMDRETFADAAVQEALAGFVCIRVDADARPDLQERFIEWGWPANIVMDADGEELGHLRGFAPPPAFTSFLRDPKPDRAVPREGRPQASTLEDLRDRVQAQLDANYDEDEHGWGDFQKYPLAAPVEHSFWRAALRGEGLWQGRALASLQQYARLMDPLWGGLFQYSTHHRWDRIHYEKLAAVQAGGIEAFVAAQKATGMPGWSRPARDIALYVLDFLADKDGGFRTSQDADSPGASGGEFYGLPHPARLASGVPTVSAFVEADSTARLAHALLQLHGVNPERRWRDAAVRAMRRLDTTHRVGDLYAHREVVEPDAADARLFHLRDQAVVGRAWLALHLDTGQPEPLGKAVAAAEAMLQAFAAPGGGFYGSTVDPDAPPGLARRRPLEDNGVAARLLSDLAAVAERPEWAEVARATLLAVGTPSAVETEGRMVGEFLLACEAVATAPIHVLVVGARGDAREAFAEALREGWHPRLLVTEEEPGRYPARGDVCAYVCQGSFCSAPATSPAQAVATVQRLVPLQRIVA